MTQVISLVVFDNLFDFTLVMSVILFPLSFCFWWFSRFNMFAFYVDVCGQVNNVKVIEKQ